MNEPTDPWAPGVRASDVPVMNGGDPNPLDTAEFEATDAPLSPNRADIAAHLYALFPPDFVKGHPDALIEIAYASPKTDDDGPNSVRDISPCSTCRKRSLSPRGKARPASTSMLAPRYGMANGQQAGQAEPTSETGSKAWADFDDEGDVDRVSNLLREKNILPSDIIQTGGTPHRRFHPYVKLSGNVTPDQLEAANARLRDWLGGDDVQGLQSLMRLAGTINYPNLQRSGAATPPNW